MVTPAMKREAVAHLKTAHEMSERRACLVIGCERMTVRYRSCRPEDAALRERLRALARERRRFGYRRLLIFLRREGFVVNHKRLFRIYREERLMVRKRGGRKRALGTRAPMPIPAAPNDLWSLDFVSDQFVCGRRFRILAVYDVSRANVWRPSPTPLCPASASLASSIASLLGAAGPRQLSATTAQNLPATRS